MREVSYVLTQLFNGEQIKNLNNTIGNNLIKANDNPNTEAIKTSQVKFVKLFSIQKLILPFIDFILTSNNKKNII